MNDTDTIELKNIDLEDISDVLTKIEKSFGFKFGNNELKDVTTFGELCDIITSKVQGINLKDCTTQQSYYKLRNAIAKTLMIEKNEIKLGTYLHEIFPRSTRRQHIATIDSELGFKTKILRPKHWITIIFVLSTLVSLIALFFYWQAGLVGFVISCLGSTLSDKLGNELDIKTVRQFADKISREHYLKVRRVKGTFNEKEINEIVKELFSHDLDLDENVLTRNAVFV